MENEYLTTRQAAEFLGSTINSLTSLRSSGGGPAWSRAEDTWHIRYRRSDLVEYLANRSDNAKAHAHAAAIARANREGPHR